MPASDRETGRLGLWWAGWHSALRLARRDVAKHRGRSLLVVLLVGLPVLLICAGATAFATDDVNHGESIPRLMGQAQARVTPLDLEGVRGQRVEQGPWADGYASRGEAAREPGVAANAPWTARRVEHLTGGSALPTATAALQAVIGDRHIDSRVLLVDGRKPVTRGMASLTSGHWPRTDDQVLVTTRGISDGLPTHGPLTLDPDGADPVTVTVVGVGTAWLSDAQHADLVALPSAAGAWDTDTDRSAYLVTGTDPVTWPVVKKLNAHGLIVESRQVFEHPQRAERDATAREFSGSGGDTVVAGIIALIVVGILLETMLLAGPAFAISAARQRRSLALIASNGARRAQIRRYVLAQAVLLGALAAVIGGALGVLVGVAGIRWWGSSRYAVNAPGPVDVPVWEVLGVVVCAAVASLVAAYIPARGAGRLDLVAVLRGHGLTARPVRRGQPVLGVVLAGIGGVVLAMSVINHGHEAQITAGALVLVGGALLLIPWMLSVASRLGRSMPLPLRMATRDIGRQRGRSAPAVAAIMTAVTTLTALAIANASDQAQAARDYQPTTVMGQGLISGGGPGWPGDTVDVVRREAPTLDIMRVQRIGVSEWVGSDAAGVAATKTTAVRVQRSSCAEPTTRPHGHGQTVHGFGPVRACSALGQDLASGRSEIGVVDVATGRERLGLTDAQADTLAHGGMLVAAHKHAISAGHVTALSGTRTVDHYGMAMGRIHTPHVLRLPATTVTGTQLDRFGTAGSTGALITPATARAHRWTTYTEALSLRDPSGTISKDTEKAITQHLSVNAHLDVERGYEGYLLMLYLVLFGVFGTLVLVATLISTALAQAEGRADLATLAAVGATRRLRRAIAGSQAFVVGMVGSLLGLVIGFVPGVALTWPLTAEATGSYDPATGITTYSEATQGAPLPPPVIDIPWVWLAVVVIGVPLLAALVSATAIRRSPQMTRRTT